MCGICGVVYSDSNRPVDQRMLWQMTDILRHRGPDSGGAYVASGVGLGIRRLSIIDLQTGDQPISNEDGTVTLVCNGEIYNFHELRKDLVAAGHHFKTNTDVETIVHLYEQHGPQCVNYLRGMFAFALWDERKRRLMLARDRLGIKPLLYSIKNDALFFGSEIKSILMSGQIDRRLNVAAMKCLFDLGMIHAPKTLFYNIRHLLAGHYLLYENGRLTLHQYWNVSFPLQRHKQNHKSLQEWEEALRFKFQEAVRIHMRSDVPVGAWLSGGIDSSSVVSIMSRMNSTPVQTFTLAFENPDFDEVKRQKNLNNFSGYNISNQQALCTTNDLTLLPKAIWHCEDPFTKAIGIPHLRISEMTSKNVKVALSGEGSDEIFGGYPWFQTFKKVALLMKLPASVRQSVASVHAFKTRWPRPARLMFGGSSKLNFQRYKLFINHANWKFDDQIFSEDLRQQLHSIESHDSEDLPLPDHFEQWDPFEQFQYIEMKARLTDYVTRNLDATSMAYSLEVRVPFLDHEFVEFCAEIPPALKMRRLQEKYILRRAMRNLLPREIAERRKKGIAAPHAQWIRDLPDFVTDLLTEKNLREKGYFNPEYVLEMLHSHLNGKRGYAPQLIGALGIHLWDQLFLLGCKPQ